MAGTKGNLHTVSVCKDQIQEDFYAIKEEEKAKLKTIGHGKFEPQIEKRMSEGTEDEAISENC